MHKSELLFILLCCFIGGVATGSFLAFSQSVLYLFFLPPLLLVGVFWRRNWKIVFVAFSAAVFLFGILRTFDARLNTTFVQKFADGNFTSTISGYVNSEIQNKDQSQQFVLRVKKLQVPGFTVPEKLEENVLVVAGTYPKHHYGDVVSVSGKLVSPKNFNDFDYISYLAKDQIYTLVTRPEIKTSDIKLNFYERTKVIAFSKIFSFKSKFEEAISRSVKEPSASFINGILLGSRQSIPLDLKNDFATASVSHVLAISGYNIVIVSSAVLWLLLFLFRRNVAFWFSVGGIFLFTILTGASASVVRSALMGGLVLLANSSGRLYSSKNSLTLVAFLMVLANPMILRFDVGFQLSFLATLGLLYVSPVLEKYLQKIPNAFHLRETFLMTLSAQIMALPLILFYFHSFSLVSLPANLIILPLIPLAMLLGFTTGLLGMVWEWFGLVSGALAWLVSSAIISVVKFFAHLKYSSLQIFVSWQGIAVIYLLIFLTLLYLNSKQKIRQEADSNSNP